MRKLDPKLSLKGRVNMRRGCIAIGEIHCDGCGNIIKHPERFLSIDEEEGKSSHYCLNCCLEKGYAHYRIEGNKQEITLLVE